MKNEKQYIKLLKEYDKGLWLNVDIVPADYHDFIVKEIAIHLNSQGLDKLREYYKSRNQLGESEDIYNVIEFYKE